MIIKILGSGCSNCMRLEASAKVAIEKMGIPAEIVKVTNMKEIAQYGVMRTPALVVDEKVVSFGKVLSPDEVVEFLQKA